MLSDTTLGELDEALAEVLHLADVDLVKAADRRRIVDLAVDCRALIAQHRSGLEQQRLARIIVEHTPASPSRCACGTIYATVGEYAPDIAFAKHRADVAARDL